MGVDFLGLIVGVPVLFFCMAQDKELGKDYAAFYSGGLFVMLTLPISMREIIKHLTNWVSSFNVIIERNNSCNATCLHQSIVYNLP